MWTHLPVPSGRRSISIPAVLADDVSHGLGASTLGKKSRAVPTMHSAQPPQDRLSLSDLCTIARPTEVSVRIHQDREKMS